tara:strand:- start:2004 stop:4817 length:2814 start_codon:yes stop_codon:yes gene_type:complete
MRIHFSRKINLSFLFIFCTLAFSQSNSLYYHKTPTDVRAGSQIEISQLLFTELNVERGQLYFRDRGEVSFQEVEMEFLAGKWIGLIPGNRVTTVGIEYLSVLTTNDGGRISLPLDDAPFENPLIIQVQNQTSDNNKVMVEESTSTDADIMILAPENGSFQRANELVISVSLFNAPNVDQKSFELFIDEKNYTDQTVIFGDVLSLVPDIDLGIGLHKIQILFKTTFGIPVSPVEWSFSTGKGLANVSESFSYKGSLVRRQSSNTASKITIDEAETSGRFEAEISWIKAKYNFKESSRNSNYSQPLNRKSLSLQITDYLRIERGDIYPSISPFILDGKRVNGRSTNADLNYGFGFDGFDLFGRNFFGFQLDGTIELKTVSGNLLQGVQYKNGINNAYELLNDNVQYDAFGNRVYLFTRKGYTFPRKINAARLAFSFNNNLKGGFHFSKVKDDFEKIKLNVAPNNLFSVDTTITGDSIINYYTLGQFIDSLKNDDTVRIKTKNWNDGSPQENLALGFDLESTLDNRKIIFQLGWNMSLTNSNIWAGTANKDSLDLMLDTIVDGKLLDIPVGDIGDLIESYQDFFTVHPLYMSPIIPIDPIAAEESQIRAILNMPASAYYIRAKASYSFNNILLEYRQLGPEYRSFGNPYLTNNIREFTFNDRLSTLGRRLMFVLSYKYRDNKLSDLVANPVASRTFSLNTTLVPGSGAPSIILNLQSIGRTNGIDSVETDQYGNYLGDSRENSQALNVMGSVNIPGNFKRFTTNTSININSISYTDNLSSIRKKDYFFQKTETQSLAATFSTRFNIPLKTTSSFNQTKIMTPYLDSNSTVSIQSNIWTSMSNTAQYSLFNNKLRVRGGIDFTSNGETDQTSMRLYGAKLGGDWDILKKLTLNLNSSLRLIDSKVNSDDGIDNDKDGEIDELRESWSLNSSGFNLTLGYRF